MWLYIILAVLVVFVTIFITLYVINYNKFQITIIKISEAEENIGMLLNEKYKLLLKIGKCVKKKTKETTYDELDNLKVEELNTFELNKELSKYDKNIIELVDYNKDIKFDNKELKVFDDLSNVNNDSVAAIRYYNDNVVVFNKLISCFPSNIIAKLKRYKRKDFYSNDKEEIFEILKS